MLIVEGTDLVGKTTLCHRLLEQVRKTELGDGHVYRHFTRLPKGFRFPQDYLTHAHRRTVQDRFHMSEIAYAFARGQDCSPLCAEKYRVVDGYLRLLPAVTVVVAAKPEVLEARYQQHVAAGREEMYDILTVLNANQAFCYLMKGNFQFGDETYSPDCDVTYYVEKEDQWPAEDAELVEKVVELYRNRQALHWLTMNETRGTFARPFGWPA